MSNNFKLFKSAVSLVNSANCRNDSHADKAAAIAIAEYENLSGRGFWEDYESEMDAREYAALSEDL